MDLECLGSAPPSPFLKWPGGKRWLTTYILRVLDGMDFKTYFEPFLGGGALFFALNLPENVILSDINPDLINTFIQVRQKPHYLIRKLQQLPVNKSTYEKLRLEKPANRIDQAIRFLYLNRTAFGGMYRLNRQGHFNVPYGGGERTPKPLWRDGLIVNAAKRLKHAKLICADFEDVLSAASSRDLVYCDPTYTVAHDNNGFIRYNERNFSWEDQKRLAATCQKLSRRGVSVIISNAAHDKILELYSFCEVHYMNRISRLCPNSKKRRPINELLFISHPKSKPQRPL